MFILYGAIRNLNVADFALLQKQGRKCKLNIRFLYYTPKQRELLKQLKAFSEVLQANILQMVAQGGDLVDKESYSAMVGFASKCMCGLPFLLLLPLTALLADLKPLFEEPLSRTVKSTTLANSQQNVRSSLPAGNTNLYGAIQIDLTALTFIP